MRKRINLGVVILMAILAVGALLSGRVLASEGVRIGQRDLMAVNPDTLLLQESNDGGSTWSTLIGNLTLGYSMVLDPLNTYEYIDIETLEATPALADVYHEFYFDAFRAPDGFWDYWAVKGVVEGATGWQGAMWSIINGEDPMFYLLANSGSYSLIDGFQKQYESVDAPLRVNGDYPLGTYHFGGWVTDTNSDSEYLNIQITFTKEATVSLTPATSTIDGCGYVDVVIHLADVHDLYAVDIELAFDQTVLEVVDLDAVETGTNLEPIDTWFVAADWVFNEADNTNGTIRYVATQRRPTEPVDEEGDIARIRFRAKSIGSSDITITKAELSDRDGYLVGRPVNFNDPAATITTDFSAAAVALDIIRLNSSTVQLSWPAQTMDAGVEYNLYRSTLPYFNVGDTGAVEMDDTAFVESGGLVTYDDAVLGDVSDAGYFYAYGLQIVCSNGFTSDLSDQVGKIEYELFETNTRDYAWVGLALENDAIIDAEDLAIDIEGHIYSGTVNVLTVGRWNIVGQGTTNYNHVNGTSKYEVFVKQPYRIEVNIDGTNSGSVIWSQVGRLPEITEDTYTLNETATTDYAWILQPLDRTDITTSDQLAVAIETSGALNVLTVGKWNGIGQGVTNVKPGSSFFNTRFGYPYRIEVQLTNGGPVYWP